MREILRQRDPLAAVRDQFAAGENAGERWWFRWLAGWRLPSTAGGVEQALVILNVGMRVGVLVRMAMALPGGVQHSPRPVLYLVSWALAAGASIAVSVVVVARRQPPGTTVVVADIVLTVGLFVIGRAAMPLEYEGGDWESFYNGYANNALLIAVATARA
ncbi:MAG: hypothetical protein ACRCYU_18315, partial [Nocardioides sp.]